jgi:predicted N-formylglutamate amidohydrolase
VKLVLTCEHGGNDIPENYKFLFKNEAILNTHRAYDMGALDLFQILVPLTDASYYSTTSRLLVELNRSLHHTRLFSEFSEKLTDLEKTNLINNHYLPYRRAVENHIKRFIDQGENVLHLSIHSFTPKLDGKTRNCDIGLLYDSGIRIEQGFCRTLKSEILKQNSHLKIRFNYPYLGKADGFTTYLRKQFKTHYLGLEIEVNQKYVLNNVMDPAVSQAVFKALHHIL